MKIASHVGDDLPIRRVVGRFDSYDPRLQGGGVFLQVLEEVELRRSGPHEEDRGRPGEALRDVAKEAMLIVRMIVAPGLLILWVTMHVVLRRLNRRFVEAAGVDVEDPRFVAIDPYRELAHGRRLPRLRRGGSHCVGGLRSSLQRRRTAREMRRCA